MTNEQVLELMAMIIDHKSYTFDPLTQKQIENTAYISKDEVRKIIDRFAKKHSFERLEFKCEGGSIITLDVDGDNALLTQHNEDLDETYESIFSVDNVRELRDNCNIVLEHLND